MPIILQSTSIFTVEIWRKNSKKVSKLLIRDKEITEIALDANSQNPDVNVKNNYWPARATQSRFDLYKAKTKDMMRDYCKKLKDTSIETINDEYDGQ